MDHGWDIRDKLSGMIRLLPRVFLALAPDGHKAASVRAGIDAWPAPFSESTSEQWAG